MAVGNDSQPAPDPSGVTRRRVLETASLLPLAAFVPDLLADSRANAATRKHGFFTHHESAVVDAATRRIAPGPDDDPAEAGHPGAHEAGVVHYIDTMLSMFDYRVPKLFAGGPWSSRHSRGPDHMAKFVRPDRAQAKAWRVRIKHLRHTYRHGVKLLDRHASGDFAHASATKQDQVLASSAVAGFTAVLFQHTIEGMYSVPEYGGNRNGVGWHEIGFPGDVMPRGYTAKQLAETEPSVLDPTGVVQMVLDDFSVFSEAFASGAWRRA
jgi:Gluconate 2-dehydrogenase subunit 3